jgi:L-2-hydroxyglutarate oxidase LhgO
VGDSRFLVVGAGIIGLATARELARRRPGATVTVVDKEPAVAQHQTGHNSGVVHAGLYYPPGSLKARLCARGRSMLREFCAEHQIAYEECGKVVVARDHSEMAALRDIEARARENAVPDMRCLTRAELSEVEPHCTGLAAVHSPHTAIVDFRAVAQALAAPGSGVTVRLGFEVTGIRAQVGGVVVSGRPGSEPVVADRIVLCAGLQSDRVARAASIEDGPMIVPFRGEYWRLRPDRSHLVRGLIYPVPDPRYPFLGVHFTRRIGGEVDLGPNAVLGLAREGYRRRDISVPDVKEALRSPAFWRMARTNWRAGWFEMLGSWSKRVFVARAATLVPDVTADDVVRAPAGIRAQALDADGSLVDDFRIINSGPVMAVMNAPSPGATSSLAIAEYICDQLD